MITILLAIHLVIAIALIGLVMMQKSEGGALGIGGGGGGLFSTRGVGNALTRATAFLAAAFFATSIALTMLATKRPSTLALPVNVQSQPADGANANGSSAPDSTGGSGLLPKLDTGKPAVPTNQ